MRFSMLILTVILAGAALPAQAQAVIDVEGQKAPVPQVQDQGQARASSSAPNAREPAAAFSSRYSFNRVDDGFLRLDNASGRSPLQCAPSRLGVSGGGDRPQRFGDRNHKRSKASRVTDEARFEIARLHDEVASLKREIAALREPPPPRPPADLSAPPRKASDVISQFADPAGHERARASTSKKPGDVWSR